MVGYERVSSVLSGVGMGAFLAFILSIRFPSVNLTVSFLLGIGLGGLLGAFSRPTPSSGTAFFLGIISSLLVTVTVLKNPSVGLLLSIILPLLLFFTVPSGMVDVMATPLSYLGGVVLILWVEYLFTGGLSGEVLGRTAYLEVLGAIVALFTPLSKWISVVLSKRLRAKL